MNSGKMLQTIACIAAILNLSGCSETTVLAPAQPFQHSTIEITSDISPRPGTVLRPGSSYRMNIDFAYTLREEDAANFERLNFVVDVQLFSNSQAYNLSPTPDSSSPLRQAGDRLSASVRADMPDANVLESFGIIGARLVAVVHDPVEGQNRVGFVMASWPVR